MIRLLFALTILAPWIIPLTGCGPSYSPNTYASNAAQQANKVDEGVIVGVRPVQISASGTVGGVAGAAAGGVAGSQVGVGTTSTFAAIGGVRGRRHRGGDGRAYRRRYQRVRIRRAQA